MKFNLVIDDKTCDIIYSALEKYLYQYGNKKISYHLNITQAQFDNIFQQFDIESYNNFEDMFEGFNRAAETNADVIIDKNKYKTVLLLMISYHYDLIKF